MSIEAFNTIRPMLDEIPAEDVKSPNTPVDVSIQESNDVLHWCQKDMPAFLKIGISKEKIKSIPLRIEGLRHIESKWLTDRFNKEQSLVQWKEESKPAYKLRDNLLHDFRYAYRKNPSVLRRIRIIGSGRGHSDMIQDLSDIAAVGHEFPKELKAIDFDMAQLDQAEELATKLSNILSESRVGEGYKDTKDLRDRAFTYLKQIIDEIREAGQYLFWKDEEKFVHFRSAYLHKHNSSYKVKEKEVLQN